MYRSGEMPGSSSNAYYAGGAPPPSAEGAAVMANGNGWYWDGHQYQQYYNSGTAGGAYASPNGLEEVLPGVPSGPPDLLATQNEEDDPSEAASVVASGAAGGASGLSTSHEEHYAFYEKQQQSQPQTSPPSLVQPPDVLQRGEPLVPSSDRNLFMETGHLDDGDVPQMDRLVLGENQETRWVPGLSSTDALPQSGPRSEAVGADRQEEPGQVSNRNVGGEAAASHGDDPEDDPEDEDEEPREEEAEEAAKDRRRQRRSSPPRGKKHRESRHSVRRSYSPEEDRRRRREDRRTTLSPPSSDEYQRSAGPSRRNSRRYSSKGNGQNNKSAYRGNDSYYYEDQRSDRSYVEDRRRSHQHHHNRSLYYESRPSSRASNYDFEYSRGGSRRHYPADPYYGNAYGPSAAPIPDPAILESFRKNWEYYSRNPVQMEALRIANPIQHATLLRYYQMYSHLLPAAEPSAQEQQVANGLRPSSRTSVHSGQSSIAEGFPRPLDQSSPSGPPVGQDEKDVVVADVTPLKFCAPHVNGSLGANGILAFVNAKNPKVGQSATVDLIPLSKKMAEDIPGHVRNLKEFPGPLIPGRTHKGEVIRFCQNKIAAAAHRKDIVDRDSYVLLWELLILLLRQKNAIDGSDIAELLLKDRGDSGAALNGGKLGDVSEEEEEELLDDSSSLDKELLDFSVSGETETHSKVTARFRDYLLYGHKKEGLEYAMKHGLWGHALFLASKMDERSYSNVMLRFANGIAANDPLQTLYQQMSGRQPIAMKECAESSWGDWRPHLAMILSNPSQKSGLDHKSILTLGDTLYEKGYLYASQFCYLMINLELGHYSDGPGAKLVLIGADHLSTHFKAFTSNVEAVQCTEIFEYVQKLSQPAESAGGISSFIFYKYLYTLRLLDFGFTSTALHYLEIIANTLAKKLGEGSPLRCDYLDTTSFMNQVLYLADRLKYLDPKYTTTEGEKSEIGDPEWLLNYRELLGHEKVPAAKESIIHDAGSTGGESLSNGVYSEPAATQEAVASQPQYTQVEYNGQMYYYDASSGQYYLIQSEQQQQQATPPDVQEAEDTFVHQQQHNSMLSPMASVDSMDAPTTIKPLPESPPVVRSRQESLNESGAPPIFTTVSSEAPPKAAAAPPPTTATSNVKDVKKKVAPKKAGGGGLLGRLFGRLVAPPNQVHLPDDKEGDIVWDEKKKCWVDSNADPAEEEASNAPPPSDSDLLKKSPIPSKAFGGGGNRFSAKGLRGRVDVFKNSMSAPSLSTLAPPPPPLEPLPIAPPLEESAGPAVSGAPPQEEEESVSSDAPPPMFYNPSQFQSMSSVGKTRRNKYV